FVQLMWDRLQARQKDQCIKTHLSPHTDEYHPESHPRGIEQKIDLFAAKGHDDRIEQAVVLKNPAPDQCDHDRRKQHRIEEYAPEKTARFDLLVEYERGH